MNYNRAESEYAVTVDVPTLRPGLLIVLSWLSDAAWFLRLNRLRCYLWRSYVRRMAERTGFELNIGRKALP